MLEFVGIVAYSVSQPDEQQAQEFRSGQLSTIINEQEKDIRIERYT